MAAHPSAERMSLVSLPSNAACRGGTAAATRGQTTPMLQPTNAPAIAAHLRLAMDPPNPARQPSLAIPARPLGAIPPRPPSRIANDPKLAKPVSANVTTAWVLAV